MANDRKPRNKPSSKNGGTRKGEKSEKAIPKDIYPVIDTDLARDNIENDIPDADLRDL